MKRTVLRGIAWVGGTMFLDRAIRYLALLVLGGLLSPRDFGLFAALVVIIESLALLQGFGIGQALIYRKEMAEEASHTSFYLSVALGLLLAVAAWLLAPAVALFYREPSMRELLRAASVILALRGLRLVPFYLFEKALAFHKKLVPGLGASGAYMVVALTLAFRGSGAWALVWAEVASVAVETLAYWLISPWRPKLSFSTKIARQDLSFGWVVLGGSVLIFAFRSIDRVVLSRAMATYYLGLYAFAYSIANIPAFLLTRVLNTVLLPSYSALSEDRDRQRELFYRATSYLAGTGSIYMLCLLAFGGYGLSSLYGDKWADAVLPLSVLSVFGLARALTDLCGDLLIGTGNPGQFRRVQAVQLAVAVVTIYPGVLLWGVTGVAVAMTVAAVAALVVAERMSGGVLAGTAGDLASAFRGPLIAFAMLVLPAFGLERVLPDGGSLLAVIAAAVAVAVSYLGVWLAVDRHLRRDIADWRRVAGTGAAGGAS